MNFTKKYSAQVRQKSLACVLILALSVGMAQAAEKAQAPRIYYTPDTTAYTADKFFNALDLPTVFGIGIVPDKPESFAYYSSLYIEWRKCKTYGPMALIGIDTHNHSYNNIRMNDCNVLSGERFGMEFLLGGGYRIPLVRDIKDFYAHPYFNKCNFSISAEVGSSFTYLKNVRPEVGEPGMYNLDNQWHFYPVVKFNANFEFFVAPKFCIFAMMSYLQDCIRQPWHDTSMAGPLSVSVGFASFFE